MSDDSLEKKIMKWLHNQGYVVEMQAAKTLMEAEIKVVQALHYNDIMKEISREIDVVGQLTNPSGVLQIYSVIECKKSSKPWMVFTSESNFNRVWSFAIMRATTRKSVINHIKEMDKLEWFSKTKRVGYGFAQVSFDSKEDRSNEDRIFSAGMSTTNAALSLLYHELLCKNDSEFAFCFPTVVLDGTLFECYLGRDEEVVVNEVESAWALFPVKIGEYRGTSIRIVTLKGLIKHCIEFKEMFFSLSKILRKEIEAIEVANNPSSLY